MLWGLLGKEPWGDNHDRFFIYNTIKRTRLFGLG